MDQKFAQGAAKTDKTSASEIKEALFRVLVAESSSIQRAELVQMGQNLRSPRIVADSHYD
jgi:hypothetical protein